jgi:hypothetical protein
MLPLPAARAAGQPEGGHSSGGASTDPAVCCTCSAVTPATGCQAWLPGVPERPLNPEVGLAAVSCPRSMAPDLCIREGVELVGFEYQAFLALGEGLAYLIVALQATVARKAVATDVGAKPGTGCMRAGPERTRTHLWALVRLAPRLALVPTGCPLLLAVIVVLLAPPQHRVPSRHASRLSMGPSCAPGSCCAACAQVCLCASQSKLLWPGCQHHARRCIHALKLHGNLVSLLQATICLVCCCKSKNASREGCRVERSVCTCVLMMASLWDCARMNGGTA